MHKVITALQHTWSLLHSKNVSAPSDIIQRSLAIVEQLKQQSTHKQIIDRLALLQQQLTQVHLHRLLVSLGLTLNKEKAPWLYMSPSSLLPSALESMGAEWRAAIKQSKDKPHERLALALKMLLVEAWGPAHQHLRLSDLHPKAWQQYQDSLY